VFRLLLKGFDVPVMDCVLLVPGRYRGMVSKHDLRYLY